MDSKADLVSIEQGTDSTVSFSNGNTLPLVARPFGHAHFAPETAGSDANRWYHPRAKNFVGYRLTHQPSPWIGDYGWLRIGVDAPATDQPPVGCPLSPAPLIREASQGWHLSPYACAVPQQRAAGIVLAELAPTKRCAILRLTIPAGAATGRLLVEFPAANGRSSVSIDLEQRRMVGKTAHHNGGADASFGCYFSVSIDEVPGAAALGGCGVWADDETAHGCRQYPPTAVAQASTAKSQPALPHGSEANGDELWIGRATQAGVVHAGKTRPGFGGVNFSHEGKPQCAKSGYDVLRVPGGAYRWVAAQGGNIPDGAVSAGGDVYVARAAVGGGVHPGEALPGVGCVVEYGGGGVTFDSYEVLVLAEGGRAEWVACTAGSLPEVPDETAAAGPAAGSPPLFSKRRPTFAGGYLDVSTSAGTGESTVLLVRVGSSFISVAQAQLNAQRELGAHGFDHLAAEGKAEWESTRALGAIEIGPAATTNVALAAAQLRTFYSCLYRSLLFPRMFHEFDVDGNTVHWSPYSHKVESGVLYTDNGFWDTHRTCYPLLSLIVPSRVAEMVAGFVNAAREGGWYPKWCSPGYRACMIGTHLDNVISDAVVKGLDRLPTDGTPAFDVAEAYRYLRKDAFEHRGDPAGCYGRLGLADFDSLGFVPTDKVEHAAARTLDFAYNDWGVLQVARRLGADSPAVLGGADELATLERRAQQFRNTFDPSIRMARGRNADGSWGAHREFAWGGAHIEGGVWQCTWGVPHDPAGLAEVMGGPEALGAALDKMLATPPTFETGSYGYTIHEMAEMAALKLGQYNHGNQPQHHCLYLYTTAAGAADKTQKWVRHVCDKHYTADADGLPGDEDNGEMCAWYVLSAIGLYQVCPGNPIYTIGSPSFRSAALHTDGKPSATIEAPENSGDNIYVRFDRSSLDGTPLDRSWVTYDELISGGKLRLSMASEPDTRGNENISHWTPTEL